MRDENRLREKIELSLEDRQVVAVAIGALLLLGGAFSLGLLVGKRLTARASASAVVDDLAALDAQRDAQKRAAPEPKKPVSEVAQQGPERSAAPPAPPLPAAPELLRAAPVRQIPAPPEATAVAPARLAVIRAPQKGSLPQEPADLGKFTVQVGATRDRAEARALAARAARAGLHPYVVEVRLPGKGLWYRVRVGAFAARDLAEKYRKDVERELRTSAVVMPGR
jgi:DedD protein